MIDAHNIDHRLRNGIVRWCIPRPQVDSGGMSMRKRVSFIVTAAVALTVVFAVGNRLTSVQGQGQTPTRVAAVPGEKGGQDMYGAYEVVDGRPKPVSRGAGAGQWTGGGG